MPKTPSSEEQIWALAYGIALAAIVITRSRDPASSPMRRAEIFDSEARAIANVALSTLKDKKVI